MDGLLIQGALSLKVLRKLVSTTQFALAMVFHGWQSTTSTYTKVCTVLLYDSTVPVVLQCVLVGSRDSEDKLAVR